MCVNRLVQSQSDGNSTFEFFDDFETPFLECHKTNISGGEPAVLCEENAKQIDMWYTSGVEHSIYYGTSTDGITFKTCRTDIPAGHARSTVLKRGDIYYLYCAKIPGDQEIHLFTSKNKINFEHQGLVLDGGRRASAANSFVWVQDERWYMLYESPGWSITLVTSPTPTGFNQGNRTQVLTAPGNGCGNPELARIGSEVIKHNGRYYMFYHRGENWRAHSADLLSWVEEGILWGYDKHDPVRGYSCGDAAVCQFNNRTYIWKSLSTQDFKFGKSKCYMAVAIANMPLRELLSHEVPFSVVKWEDAAPDARGYPKYPDVDIYLARTGKSSIYLNKQYWRTPRDVDIRHAFRPSCPIIFTAYFYDNASDMNAEAHIDVKDLKYEDSVSMGVCTDISRTHYVVSRGGAHSASIVPRKAGWRRFEFIVGDSGTIAKIDGIQVCNYQGMRVSTMGYIGIRGNKEKPMNASIDSVSIRKYADSEPNCCCGR